ncbi:MAG: mechanosensitive ion channel family protein [Firmicutes bacterium]|nr:mechanosensitive ion channel family protein [Bacillota bacterium]
MERIQDYIRMFFDNLDIDIWQFLTQTGLLLIRILAIIVIAWLLLKAVRALLPRLLLNDKVDPAQGKTLVSLLHSLIRYVVYFIAGLTILVLFDIPVMPILTSAGIVGLAVGFGAQNLVRDFISGFFILFEGQFHVGDFVQINGDFTGTVEEIGLRVTKIREWSQRLHYIANGEISRVTNYNRQRMRPIISVTVPYKYEQKRVEEVLEQVCRAVAAAHHDQIIEDPSVFGITDIGEKGITFTLIALVLPDSYWFIERMLRKEILAQFAREGIEIAYPHRVFISSDPDRGTGPLSGT